MNRKEYKLLVEGWKGYLNEIASDISGVTKIKSFVDRIVALREETGKDIKIRARLNGTVLEVNLLNYSVLRMNGVFYQKAWLNHLGTVDRNVKVNGERDPYVIKYSDVGGGFGPLLYEIGLEIVSCNLDGALMSDRSEVSEEAERVWDRYLRRAKSEFNLEAVKMDFSDESWDDVMYDAPFSDMSDEEQERFKQTKKYTEDDPTDDIYQYSAILNSAEKGNFVDGDWKNFESPLAYAYYKLEPEVLNYIETLDENLIEIDL
jgi:hypothetical protein